MDLEQLYPFAIIGFLVIGIPFMLLSDIRRAKALKSLAKQLNMSYLKKPGPQIVNWHLFFDLFSHGDEPRVSNLMKRAENNLHTLYFEYSYQTGFTEKTTHIQSVVSIHNPSIKLPYFVLKPEHMLSRISKTGADKDICFDSYPEFNKAFQLRGHKENKVRSLFSKEIIRHFELSGSVTIESQGDRIIFYQRHRRCPVYQIEGFIRDALETYELLIDRNQTVKKLHKNSEPPR